MKTKKSAHIRSNIKLRADSSTLKKTVSRDFDPFLFGKKNSTWAPYVHQTKRFTKFFVFAKIFAKKTCVGVVVDSADTRISNFIIKYLRYIFAKTKNFSRNYCSLFMWGSDGMFKANNTSRKSRETDPVVYRLYHYQNP